MNEQSFFRKVSRLNTNILYLCYTQRVKLNTLSPKHTLENISKLLDLDCSDLGRIGPVDINDGFINLINVNQHSSNISTDSSSDDEGSLQTLILHILAILKFLLFSIFFYRSIDENALPTEWEAVSHPQQPSEILFPPNMQNTQQTVSVAGGLVTSAVQSVASIWRVFTTGNRN